MSISAIPARKLTSGWRTLKIHVLTFILFSIGLHVLGFSLMWEHEELEGTASGSKRSSAELAPTVLVGFIAKKNPPGHDGIVKESEDYENFKDSLNNLYASRASTVIPHANEADKASNPLAAPLDDYFTAGELTRLPAPATSIDLDVPEVKEVADAGSVQLTILINADGTVADVLNKDKSGATSEFSERVMEIFRRARFVPGEVNGKAVKALLEINVVSEELRML
jgi:TonB family protein